MTWRREAGYAVTWGSAGSVGATLALGVVAGLLSLVLLPGAAQARVSVDPCDGPHLSVDASGVCTELTQIPAYKDAVIGGPVGPDFGLPNFPPGQEDEPECFGGYRIAGTGTYNHSRAWDWDYYVEGGYWILWDGDVPGRWPFPGSAGDETGLYSIGVHLDNWNYYYPVKTRVFWECEPIGPGTSVVAGPSYTGGGADDALAGDGSDNELIGNAGDDRLAGGAGQDHLHSGTGDDVLFGGDGADELHARSGDDRAHGGDGADDILTSKGDDISDGGRGGDQLFDNEGRDRLSGGRGNDRFSAVDGDRDIVDCGPGEDIAMLDRFDKAIGCEHVYRNAREVPKKLPKI
jgi:hypothetical protein